MSLLRTVVTFISGAALALSPWASSGAELGNCFSEKSHSLVVERDRVGLSEELRSLAQGDEKRFIAFSRAVLDSQKGPGDDEYSDEYAFSRRVIHPRGGGVPEIEVLTLHFPASRQYSYFFFFKQAGQWNLGDTAVEVESLSGSDLGLAENNGDVYISISRKGGGTGGYADSGDVYWLNEGKVVRVMSGYPIAGQYRLSPETFGCEYSSRLCFAGANDAKGSLSLSLRVSILAENDPGRPSPEKEFLLFDKKLRFAYSWNQGRKAYVIVGKPGRVNEDPGEMIVDEYTRSSALIVSSFEELRRIAVGKDAAKKRWLRAFLDDEDLDHGEAKAKKDMLLSLLRQ